MSCDAEIAKNIKQQQQKYEKLLKKQSILAQSNDLMKIMQDTIADIGCDPACERAKKEAELLKDYKKAQIDVYNGPSALETTSKKYYTFAQGDYGYNQFNISKLNEVGENIATNYSKMFNDIVNTSKTFNNVYQSDFINVQHAKKLHNEYIKQNDEMEQQIRDTFHDITTNDRKGYYEDQELTTIQWWYYVYLFIFAILVLTFIVSAFVVPSNYSKRWLVAIGVFLLLYVFIASYLARMLIKFYFYIGSLFPKNVYLAL